MLPNRITVRPAWLFLLLSTFLLASCSYPCLKSPLSDPDKAKLDAHLVGAWKPLKSEEKKQHPDLLIIGKAEQRDAPPGIMKTVWIEIDKKNLISADDDNTYFFTTAIGDRGYAQCFDKVVFDRNKFPKWDQRNIKGYTLVKYKADDNQLTIWLMDADATEAVIRKGEVKGTVTVEKRGSSNKKKVITVTDGKSLSKYLANGGDTALFPDNDENKMVFSRIK